MPASKLAAASFECALQDPDCTTSCEMVSVNFEIDESQLSPAQNPNDPPRRQITTVTMDGVIFVAQAIKMQGNVYGFHEDAGALGSRLMIVKADGAARLLVMPVNIAFIGQCRTTSP